MNAQPQFTGPRFHRRPLRYTQAPAMPAEQQYAQAISRTVRHSRVVRRTVLGVPLGCLHWPHWWVTARMT